MAINPALTADEAAALAGVSTLLRYLSPIADVDIATARINQSTFVYSLFQLTVDNTSADWADVQAGDTVYVGTSAGASDVGIYRVRSAGNSTTLYLGETSSQDVGQIPIAIRTAGFADNQYITVKRRFDLWSVLPVINPATGTTYEDGTLVVSTNNTTPEPLVEVTLNNRRNHLADYITGSTLAITAIATPTSWTTSAGETFDYAWTVPAEWTGVSGDTTDTLTADAPPGNYVLYLSVTGSLSGTTERVCFVNVHSASDNPPLLISEMPRSDTRDRTGRRISFDLYSNRLASIPNGAMVIYFEVATWANQWVNSGGVTAEALDTSETGVDVDDGSLFAEDDILLIDSEQVLVTGISTDTLTVTRAYNGTTAAAHTIGAAVYIYHPATDVPTATRQMAGWLQRQDKNTGDGLRQATVELMSPSLYLSQLNSTSQLIKAVASPSTWQEVKPALSSASFLCWYMLRWRCANVLKLFDFVPFSVDPAGQRLPEWVVDKGTVLQQLQTLATERGNFGCDSEGSFYFLRHPNLEPYPRSGTVVRDELDASLYKTASNPRELLNRVQQVRGEAFFWDGAAVLPTPGYSDAPKVPGQGTSQIKLPSQVVTNQAELEQLTGDRYAQANNPYPVVEFDIWKNRDVIEPAQMEFVHGNIPDTLSADGQEWDGNLVPTTVTKTHNADGTANIKVSGEGETHNLPGDFVPVPVGNDSLFTPEFVPTPIDDLPPPSMGDFASVTVPAAVPSPQGATVSPGKGAIWVSADGTKIYRTLDRTVASPTIDDITPSGFNSTAFVMVVHHKAKNFSRGAYALGNDGTDSYILYTTDVYADTVTWVEGTAISGIATQIESAGMASLDGSVAVYTIPTGVIDVRVFTTAINFGGTQASQFGAQSGVSFNVDAIARPADPGGHYEVAVYATGDFHMTYSASPTPLNTAIAEICWLYTDTSDVLQFQNSPAHVATDMPSGIDVRLLIGSNTKCLYWNATEPFTLTITLTGSSSGTDAAVYTSDDFGATVSSVVVGTGAVATDAAFCLSRFGTVSLAAVDAAVEKAATFGGSYSSVTGGDTTGTYPIAARIPWFRVGSSSLTNNSNTPDFLLASAALVSGEALWKVDGGTPTAITPSVTGTKGIGVSSNCLGTWKGKQIVYLADVSGTEYVFTTKNTGTSWTHVQIDNLNSVRAQRFDPSGKTWILGTDDTIYISTNGGTSWSDLSISGGAKYAELFG